MSEFNCARRPAGDKQPTNWIRSRWGRPGEPTRARTLPETGPRGRTRHSPARSRRWPGGDETVDLVQRDLRLGAGRTIRLRHAGPAHPLIRAASPVQLSGRNSRKPTKTATSPLASVSETIV